MQPLTYITVLTTIVAQVMSLRVPTMGGLRTHARPSYPDKRETSRCRPLRVYWRLVFFVGD